MKAITCYGDCSPLSELELMFCLLHEESHLTKPQNANRLVAIWMPLIISTIAFFVWLVINRQTIQPGYLFILILAATVPIFLR